MALSHEFPREFLGAAAAGERAERVMRVPLGVVSPMWAMFGAAAGMGIAYWWMTSWTRAVNIEALSAFAPKPAPPAKAKLVEIVAEPEPSPWPRSMEAVAEAALRLKPAFEPPRRSSRRSPPRPRPRWKRSPTT